LTFVNPRLPWALAGAAVLLEVPYPLVDGELRDVLTIAAVVAFFLAVITHAVAWRGAAYAVLLVLVTAGGGLLVEAIGTRTGRPFGRYTYSGTLGPAVLGVPAVIPLAWTMMGYPALLAARRIAAGRTARLLLGAVALASWDLFLDPQMVTAGHWRWDAVGIVLPGVAEIPLTNFAGWAVVALAMMAALSRLPDRPDVDDRPMHALYLWTYGSSVLLNLAWLRRRTVAAWGGAAMGTVALPLAFSLRRR
jgi:putative membrane protein